MSNWTMQTTPAVAATATGPEAWVVAGPAEAEANYDVVQDGPELEAGS